MVRLPELVSSLFRRDASRERHRTESVGLLDIAKALLSDDDEDTERVAGAIARGREVREREAAQRRERDEAQRRREAGRQLVERDVKRQGYFWPSDHTGRSWGRY